MASDERTSAAATVWESFVYAVLPGIVLGAGIVGLIWWAVGS